MIGFDLLGIDEVKVTPREAAAITGGMKGAGCAGVVLGAAAGGFLWKAHWLVGGLLGAFWGGAITAVAATVGATAEFASAVEAEKTRLPSLALPAALSPKQDAPTPKPQEATQEATWRPFATF